MTLDFFLLSASGRVSGNLSLYWGTLQVPVQQSIRLDTFRFSRKPIIQIERNLISSDQGDSPFPIKRKTTFFTLDYMLTGNFPSMRRFEDLVFPISKQTKNSHWKR